MALHSSIIREALHQSDALNTGDLRKHRRLPLSLPGRFMRADRSEYTCQLKNVSVGAAAVITSHAPGVGAADGAGRRRSGDRQMDGELLDIKTGVDEAAPLER